MYMSPIRYLLLASTAALGLLYLLSRWRRCPPTWAVLLPGLIVISAMAVFVATQVDDAYITYRYARNFADGHGPVYNPGEQVEGYSSPLWMLLLTGGLLVGIAPTTLAPILAGGLLLALLGLLDRILIYHEVRSVWLRGLLPLALGLSPAFVLWWFCGLEVPAYAVGIVGVCWLLCRLDLSGHKSMACLGILVALVALTRPEGLLLGLVVVIYLLASKSQTVQAGTTRSVLYLLGPLVGALAILTAARLMYYGEWLPNTYYCKLGGGGFSRIRPGLLSLIADVRYLEGTAPLIVATMGLVWARPRGFMKWAAIVLLAYISFIVYSGGDGQQHRFLTHITPLLYVMVWIGGVAVARRLSPASAGGRFSPYLTGLALLVLFAPTVTAISQQRGARRTEQLRHRVGALLTENVPRDFEMAIGPAGGAGCCRS